MKRRSMALAAGACLPLLMMAVATPMGRAGDTGAEMTVRYLLGTVKAFRTVYAHSVIEQAKKGGVETKENWMQDDHAIMLPFQLVKLAAADVKGEFKDLEIGIVSLTPIYSSNFPETPAEVEALKQLTANPKQKMLAFADGNQFKGLAADFAIEQACADCHNHHPNSPRQDYKKGDLMGAIVVRLKK